MKKYISVLLIIGLVFGACSNQNEKEIGEVNGLLSIVEETEKSLLSIDTSLVFSTKRQMDKDLAEFNSVADTMTREEAFRIDDIFGTKKRMTRLTTNYTGFISQINFSKDQLNNLKQDLENGLMKKEDFAKHYKTEQNAIISLNTQINKVIGGIEDAVEKFKKDRPELLEMIKQKKLDSEENE